MTSLAHARFDPDVEETLLRVYNVDSHSVTFRRLKVLLERLPLGSWKKDQGPASWTQEAYLMAALIDSVNQVSWVVAQSNSKKRIPVPKPIERPGQGKSRVAWSEATKQLAGMEGVIVNG